MNQLILKKIEINKFKGNIETANKHVKKSLNLFPTRTSKASDIIVTKNIPKKILLNFFSIKSTKEDLLLDE